MRSTRIRLISHGIALGLFFLLLTFGVPRVERPFTDFGIPLPRATILVIRASHWPIAISSSILVLLGIDGYLLEILSRRGDPRWARTWSALMIATPLVIMALILAALGLPLITMDTSPLSG